MKFFVGLIAMASVLTLIIFATYSSKPSKKANNQKAATVEGLIGKPASDFSLTDQNGKTYTPESLKDKKTVLFFNEGIMCYPACWNQTAALASDKRFAENGIAAFSIVPDTASQWQKAFYKMPELKQAAILFDWDNAVSKKYGVLDLPSSMHKGAMPGHTYVLIDRQGVVRYIYDDPAMAVNNNLIFEELSKID